MNVQDYLIAVYFIVAYLCLLTLVVAVAFAVFVFLQRREVRRLRAELEALKGTVPEKPVISPAKDS